MWLPQLGRRTLGLLVLLLCALLLPIIGLALQAREHVQHMATVERQRAVVGRELEINLLGYALAVRRYQTTSDQDDVNQARLSVASAEQALQRYREYAYTPAQAALAREYDALWLAVKNIGELVLVNRGGPSAVDALARMRVAVIRAEAFLDTQLQPDAAARFAHTRDQVVADIGLIVWFAFAMLALGLAATLIVGLRVSRHIIATDAALQQLNAVLESKVAERTAELQRNVHELERSNLSLQEFAAVAAHDLQTPLRAVTSYAALLRESWRGKLSEQDERFLRYVIEGGARMQAMTLDLLAYAKITDPEARGVAVELEGVLDEVMADLRVGLEAVGGTLSHDPLPRVQGVRTEYRLVLRNLIGNAIKFHGPAALRIHVSVQTLEGGWRVAVEDNGIGFDPQYRERIFQVFRRLHTAQSYPGSGIGLALVKRIIEYRGGSVGADSTPGHGSNFWFTIINITNSGSA